MQIDYIIVGQGLCGTFLSYYLMKAGKKVLVIDDNKPFTASKVASGVINPVTGRRIVRTWRIEELLPFAWDAYTSIGNELGVSLVTKCNILDFHPTQQMKEAFERRLQEEPEYLKQPKNLDLELFFSYYFGVGEINPCLLVNIGLLIEKWREQLQEPGCFLDEKFNFSDFTYSKNGVTYKYYQADKILFCDGFDGVSNPYFKNLPYAPNKGEVIIARIPKLPRNNIYKQGLSIVPWKDDLFWIGSSYEWTFSHDLPTVAFKERITSQLKQWLKLPFEIVEHLASVRPANLERRPFVGMHPQFEHVGILNGMGTKGCSLAPFFARQLTDHLIEKSPIYVDADVKRFERILARKIN